MSGEILGRFVCSELAACVNTITACGAHMRIAMYSKNQYVTFHFSKEKSAPKSRGSQLSRWADKSTLRIACKMG